MIRMTSWSNANSNGYVQTQGELAISSEMEKLQTALFFDNVPDTWTKLAYPSTYSLAIWWVERLYCISYVVGPDYRQQTVNKCVCVCVSGTMTCCSAAKSWTAGLRTCLYQVSSGCLDFLIHSLSSQVNTHALVKKTDIY